MPNALSDDELKRAALTAAVALIEAEDTYKDVPTAMTHEQAEKARRVLRERVYRLQAREFTDLAVPDDGLEGLIGEFTETGWIPPCAPDSPDKPLLGAWCFTVRNVATVLGIIHYWLGDLIEWGEAAYGEKYSQALDLDLFSYWTLTRDARVAREIPRAIRQPTMLVSYTTQTILAKRRYSLAQKKLWLERAAEGRWSGTKLQAELALAYPPLPSPPPPYSEEGGDEFVRTYKSSLDGSDPPAPSALVRVLGVDGGRERVSECEQAGELGEDLSAEIACPHCGALFEIEIEKNGGKT